MMSDLRKAAQELLDSWDMTFNFHPAAHRFEKLRAALAQHEPIPGATPMAEYAAKSAAVPGRAEALKQAGYTRRPRQLPKEDAQEPVAYRFQSPATEAWLLGLEPPVGSRWEIEPLYAAPPQRKPLTDEEIEDLGPISFTWRDMMQFARAIEKAHGIGVKS
jgi:hypothetical protein